MSQCDFQVVCVKAEKEEYSALFKNDIPRVQSFEQLARITA